MLVSQHISLEVGYRLSLMGFQDEFDHEVQDAPHQYEGLYVLFSCEHISGLLESFQAAHPPLIVLTTLLLEAAAYMSCNDSDQVPKVAEIVRAPVVQSMD